MAYANDDLSFETILIILSVTHHQIDGSVEKKQLGFYTKFMKQNICALPNIFDTTITMNSQNQLS